MKHRFNVFALTAMSLLMATTTMVGCKKDVQSEVVAEVSEVAGAAAGSTSTSGTITAQSVQVNVEGLQQYYQIAETETWSYDFSSQPASVEAFATYFTLSTAGGPSASQIQSAMHQAFINNRCNLWSGAALVPVTKTFGQSKSVTCTPVALDAYAPKTGWTVETSGTGTVDVNLNNIFVASESYQERQEKKGVVTKKYSFTMRNDIDQSSRLTGLKIELLRNDEVVETRADLAQTLQDNADWYYVANGGSFGNSLGQYALLSGAGSERNVSEILLGPLDNFAGNNGIGGTRALIDNQTFSSLALDGNYKIKISGTIKGNSFTADQSFSITRDVVTVGGCN